MKKLSYNEFKLLDEEEIENEYCEIYGMEEVESIDVFDDKIELEFTIEEDDIEPSDYPDEDDGCDSINEKLEANIVSDIEDTYNQFFSENFNCEFEVEVETLDFNGCEFEESSYDWECGNQLGTEHYVSCEKNASGEFKVTVTLYDKEVKA